MTPGGETMKWEKPAMTKQNIEGLGFACPEHHTPDKCENPIYQELGCGIPIP